MKALYEYNPDAQLELIKFHLDLGRVVGRTEGSFGDLLFLAGTGQPLVAKCPRITKFGNPKGAPKALEKAIYEIESTSKYCQSPGVHRFAPPRLILGWPFFVSQRRDGTLRELFTAHDRWSVP